MKRIYNKITGKIDVRHKSQNIENYEFVLSEHFETLENHSNYKQFHIGELKRIVSKNSVQQEQVDKLTKIKTDHYNVEVYPEISEIKDSLRWTNTNASESDITTLITITKENLSAMNTFEIDTLLELSESINTLLQITVQPYLMCMLSIPTYIRLSTLLFSDNYFKTLVEKTRRLLVTPFYTKIHMLSQESISYTLRSLNLRNFIMVGTSIMVLAGIPMLIYTLITNIQTVEQTRPREPGSKRINLPLYESNRVGGKVSEIVDKAAFVLQKCGAEVAILTKSFIQGFIGEYLSISTNTIENDRTNNSQNVVTENKSKNDTDFKN